MNPEVLSRRSSRFIVATLFVVSSVGCAAEPRLSAWKKGDLSYPLAARTRPDAEAEKQCGTGKLTDVSKGQLLRSPYLQEVTESSADVLFTAAGGEAVTIDVTRPDGSLVASVSAERDPSAVLSGTTWQGVVRLTSLEPNTLYCYALQGLTERAGFRTAPSAASTDPVRFIAFGDSGTGSSYQYAVERQMFTVPFDLVLHTGDVAYDNGTLDQLEHGYFHVYPEISRTFPAFLVAGNHDYATEQAAPFRQAFALPENGRPSPAGVERWYSFDWGRVHFVGLDTERIGPEQAAWLDQDLGATTQPWKIVFGHRPPFSSGEHGSNQAFQQYFVPAIERHRVALVLNGHDHDYERTVPINGTIYVVTGGGGEGTRSVGSSSFTAFSVETLHFVSVEVYDKELLLHAIDGTGVEFDTARIPVPG